MRKTFLLCIAFSLSLIQSFAQGKYTNDHQWHYSPQLTEDQLYQYERLLYMSRDDWDQFRTDSRYDDERVREIYRHNKGKIPHGQTALAKTRPPGDCDCWIEPDNSYTATDPNNWPECGGGGPGVDCWIGPINLPFDFCFYGQNFNEVYFTSKGTIVFGSSGYIDWTPSEFPVPVGNEPEYDHICAFWADFDWRQTGELRYKVTDEALYVNYIEAGYWANHDDKTNTFQVILAANNTDILANGNNVQFCYQNMNWAHGDVGGNAGFDGPTPATVGADRIAGTSHIQFGRFNKNSSVYNGPYGQNTNQQDGVNWLDNQTFGFNTCESNSNVPPIATGSAPCDTIVLCLGNEYDISLQFLSPETGQITSVTTSIDGTGYSGTSIAGNTASMSGTFTASSSNVGTNTLTINAEDNGSPSGITTIIYVFNVLNIQAPDIAISGVLDICAGGQTELTATAGFNAYAWSTGCDTQSCTISDNGSVTVIGYANGCASTATAVVNETAYFIPDLVGGNEPIVICPGQDSSVCVIEQNDYVTYEWFIYPGYEGEFIPNTPLDQSCAQVTGNVNGNYGVLVTDSNGCQGQNIKLVQIIQSFIDPINDENNGAYCDGLESVEFTGGFSNPAQSTITIYTISSWPAGWQGSYLNVQVFPAGGGAPVEYIMTTSSPVTLHSEAVISVGDSIVINYVSSGIGDENNSIYILNCGNEIDTIIQPPLTNGVLWTGLSDCTSSPLNGNWTVTPGAGWTLSNDDEFNTVFTPTQYGLYHLCFADPACPNLEHCYDLEFTEPPTLSIMPEDTLVTLCDNSSWPFFIDYTDLGGSGDITWTGTGIVIAPDEISGVAGPYTGYTSYYITSTISNGCGTATDSLRVDHEPNVPDPVLSDQFLCNNGSVILDPIPSNLDNVNLEYDWTPNGETTATLNVTSTGTYSVAVHNACDESTTAMANITLVPAAVVISQPPSNLSECDANNLDLTVQIQQPGQYAIAWDNGQTGSQINVTSDGVYCFTITDNQGCNTIVTDCVDINFLDAPTAGSGSSDISILCPNECESLSLNAQGESIDYIWTSSCSYPFGSGQNTMSFCSASVPSACLGSPIQITGTASNACGSSSATWYIQANACQLTIPNIITANGDSLNNIFVVIGLENYTDVKLYVFNRWGNSVFESMNYKNDWSPADLDTGVYFYVIELPFGVQTAYEGNFTVVK
jgi:gliding motility-associated-like protein